jgi:protein TonB
MDGSHQLPDVVPPAERPRLEVGWVGVWEPLLEALRTLLTRLPVLPADATLVAFRDAAVQLPRLPSKVLLLSLTLHVLFLVLPLPEFLTRPPERPSALSMVRIEYDLQWMGNSRILPPISPTPRPKPEPSPGGQEDEPLPPPGAEVVQAQTIVSSPPEPNHPTQTLLQQSGLEKARVQTAEVKLPNMVIPPASAPATEIDLRRLRVPGAPVDLTGPPAAPVVPRPKSSAELALENTQLENLLPRLTLPTSRGTEGSSAAPEVNAPLGTPRSGDLAAPGVIALAANPAAPAPVMQLPEANLRARFVAGPFPGRGSPGGVPGGVPGASGGSGGGPGGEGGGPGGLVAPDLLVTPAGPVPSGPVIVGAATGAGPPAPPTPSPAPTTPETEGAATPQSPADKSPQERAEQLLEGIRPGSLPGEGAPWRRVYTIYINMPNLSSQSGSWVLRFAELGDASRAAAGGAADSYPLAAPVPIRKVDPRYPAAARRQGVEGTVSLYGIIRSDGSVANVQVIRSLHRELDQSAVAAFQRWVFAPGHKNGTAVNLEVVVEVPFRLSRLF